MVLRNLSLQSETYGLSIRTSNLCKLEKNKRKGLALASSWLTRGGDMLDKKTHPLITSCFVFEKFITHSLVSKSLNNLLIQPQCSSYACFTLA